MVSLDLKDYEPPNPFEHAANALDPLAFIARWPKKTREARLTVVKVLLALRELKKLPMGDILYGRDNDSWTYAIDEILSHAPPELLEAAKS